MGITRWFQSGSEVVGQPDRGHVQILPLPTGASTGDGAMINAFIAAQSSGTRITTLPGYTYLIDQPVVLRPDLRYDFSHYYPSSIVSPPPSSAAGTVFRMAAGANLNYMFASQAYVLGASGAMDPPIWVTGLCCDGNKTNQTGGTGHGLVLTNLRSTVRSCGIVNSRGHGIYILGRGADGSQLTGSGVENIIDSCWIDGSGGNGIYVHGAGNLVTDGICINNRVSNTGLVGIQVDAPAGWVIAHNHAWATTLSAITTTGSYATQIHNNYIEGYGGLPGMAAAGNAYSAGTTYSMWQVVTSSSVLYYSLTDNNTGNTPASSPTQWQVIGTGLNMYGIACFTMGYPRPTHVHDNVISLAHVSQGLTSILNYRGILLQSPTSNTAYGICHDNVMQNELQPAGTNTTALRYGIQSAGVLDVTSHHNRILGNWNATTSIDGTVVTNGTTY